MNFVGLFADTPTHDNGMISGSRKFGIIRVLRCIYLSYKSVFRMTDLETCNDFDGKTVFSANANQECHNHIISR